MKDAAAAIEELDAEETRLLLLTSELQDKLMDAQAEVKRLEPDNEDYEYTLRERYNETITLEQAIDRLHELGWLQEHDRIISQPHWVSVEEMLPEVDVNVLVYAIGKIDGFIGETVIALTSMSDTNWLNHHEKVDKPYWLGPWQYFLTDYRITHWMPLPSAPEPPKEVQDGPIITPCRGCSDYDGYGGCKSKGGCARKLMEVQDGQ